jgi:hypothetical protein
MATKTQKSKTFASMMVLKEAQLNCKLQLGVLYDEKVRPFIIIVQQIMEANEIDAFTALLKIKNETELYNKTDAPVFFASAVVEIIGEKYFKDLRDE